jgi:methyl-accepting chemotaxis protein
MLSFSKTRKSSVDTEINNLKTLLDEATGIGTSNQQKIAAIDRSLAMIEFSLDGRIVNANENFLNTLGYSLEEIVGRHHRIFVAPEEAHSLEYENFWSRLRRGEFFSGEFIRLAKSGKRISLQATYNPLLDSNGNPIGVIKYAMDTTDQKLKVSELQSKNDLVEKTFAVIQFTPEGVITYANQNFLSTVGYSMDEIRGKHHSMFVDPDYRNSAEYKDFWNVLRSGRFHAGEFRRVGRGGKEIYIQASYNPIFGLDGEIASIVKFASDITQAVQNRKRSSQVASAVSSSVSEMTHTIREISNNVSSTATLAKEAESLSVDARRGVEELDGQSRTIGKVVETIRDLAEQTNLLALNATIESARAGEAGRGFAVVASEVKELAKQTSKATQSIEQTVRLIQDSISAVVSSTENISNSVANVSQNMLVISAAVEEQSVTMRSLTDTAQELQYHDSHRQ